MNMLWTFFENWQNNADKNTINTFFTLLRIYFYISNSIFPPIPPEARTRSSAPRWQLSPSPGTRHQARRGELSGERLGKCHTPTISYDDSNDSNHESQGWWVGETWIALLWLCQLHCVCSILIILVPEWYNRKLPSLSSDCTNTIVCSVLSCDSSIVDLMTTCMMTLFIYRVQREQLAIYYCIEHALVSSHTLHSALLHFPSSSWYSADDY